MRRFLARWMAVALAGCAALAASGAPAVAASADNEIGFLAAAPDRGGAGNDRVRQAFKALTGGHPAQLVFITDERSAKYVDQALARLKSEGADEIVALPLFLSRANPKFALLTDFLDDNERLMPVRIAQSFGDSYLAIEMLAERLRRAGDADVIVIAGNGGQDADGLEAMRRDLAAIAHDARQGVFSGEVNAIIWPERDAAGLETLSEQAWSELRAVTGRVRLVPFHMGREFDSMMSFNATLKRDAPEGVAMLPVGDDELEWFTLWMQREINHYTAVEDGSVGIVFNAHGADFHWNQTMRETTAALAAKYPIEYAFSMAGPPSLRKAVRRLEDRGVRAIVIVRVFGMESSFRSPIERLIGWDAEHKASDLAAASPGGGMDMGVSARLKTAAMIATAGGLQDNALFAEALLDRAKEISTDPAKETIILVAHGQGGDRANEAWLQNLASLAEQMKQMGGTAFRDILYQTWREDWPEKRAPHILAIREMVEAAQRDDGVALIIPARTTGKGPADEYLEGLTYRAGTGFAPHPLFAKWVEQEFLEGLEQIRQSRERHGREDDPLDRPVAPESRF